MNTIPNHSNMTATDMGLSPEIIIHDNLRPMSMDDRLDEYRAKLSHAMKSGHGVTCEVADQFVDANKMVEKAKPNNISLILRKGGAK